MIDAISKDMFRDSGFTDKELNLLADARSEVSAMSPAWISTRRTREYWIKEMSSKGLTQNQIRRAIDHYYDIASRKDSSPFAFLKAEYQPKKVADFQTYNEQRKKTEARIMRKLNQAATDIQKRG